jgi:hypothetical protein
MADIRVEMINRFKVYEAVIPFLKECLEKEGSMKVTDLEVINGGYWKSLRIELEHLSCSPSVHFDEEHPEGFKTIFSKFHDHNSEKAKAMLLEFQKQGDHILIVEGRQRKWRYFIPALLSPLAVLILTPFVRPFRFDRLFFTYLIPVLPLAIFWDELVGVLRTYDIQDIGSMLFESMDEKYFWEMSSLGSGSFPIQYIYGRPEKM